MGSLKEPIFPLWKVLHGHLPSTSNGDGKAEQDRTCRLTDIGSARLRAAACRPPAGPSRQKIGRQCKSTRHSRFSEH
jgi:hypothetical protein